MMETNCRNYHNETHWEMKFSHSLILDENNRQEYARMMTNNNKEIKILMETNDRNYHNFSQGRVIIRTIRAIRGQKDEHGSHG